MDYEKDMIMTSAGSMTTEQFEKYKQRQKEQKEREHFPAVTKEQIRRCPMINGIHKTCLEKCAWYDLEEKQCRLQELPAEVETIGKVCPLSFGRAREHCNSNCAMFKKSCCTLLSLFRKGAEEQ